MNDATANCALVTGAGARIGRAIAVDLARRGWAVAVHYNEAKDAAQQTVDEIVAAGGRAAALQADLVHEAQVETLVPRAAEALGPLSCLINNASVFEQDSIASATRDTWDGHMEVNLRAPFRLIQTFEAALPAEAAGYVINMIDQRVWKPTPYFLSYTVSKAGLWTLTRTLALALAPRIRVNAIGPGPTLPNYRQTAEQFEAQRKRTPLGRGATVEEICDAVRFILEAPAMTGQMIALDGGQHLGWTFPPPGPIDEE